MVGFKTLLGIGVTAIGITLYPLRAYGQGSSETFQDRWMGRIAWPPSDGVASIYWEDTWDARGKRFKPRSISCAHRTEKFGTIFVVTNLYNQRRIECPVQDRGPYHNGRILDLSLGAARKLGCSTTQGLCPVIVRRKGYE